MLLCQIRYLRRQSWAREEIINNHLLAKLSSSKCWTTLILQVLNTERSRWWNSAVENACWQLCHQENTFDRWSRIHHEIFNNLQSHCTHSLNNYNFKELKFTQHGRRRIVIESLLSNLRRKYVYSAACTCIHFLSEFWWIIFTLKFV